jgi:hypothetical protein
MSSNLTSRFLDSRDPSQLGVSQLHCYLDAPLS